MNRGLRFGTLPWVAFGLASILLLSGNFLVPASSTPVPPSAPAAALPPLPAGLPPPSTPTPTTLTVSNVAANLSSQFWGTTVNNEVRMFRGETDAVNATPARVLVWPGAMAGEDYDPLTDTHYNTYDGTPTPAQSNESQFVALCKATHCTAIVQVPAEIDNPSIAEAIVNYTEVNLSFHPAYWMIGNEPELWYHWKVAWKNWGTTFTTGPTPTQFGDEVVAYVKVIRAVDNTTPILGLPASGCSCSSWTFDQWIAGVLAVTGDKIQAVAFHEYPAGWLGTGDGSLLDFYATLQGAAGIPTRMAAARLAVQTSCPKCNVSVFISEIGSALSWSAYGPYAIGFSGALSLASQFTQAMDVNLSNVDLFAAELNTTNSWFNPHGAPRPDYTLYTSILDHLGNEAYAANFSGLGHSIYGIDTVAPGDHSRRDLLVANDNITRTIAFAPQFAHLAESGPVEVWYWNGSIHTTAANATTWVEPFTPTPIPELFPNGLPANFTLPPQSLVLFEAYPAGGTYVRLAETGVPAGTAWYAQVGAQFYSTTADNLSLLLAPGAYPIRSVPIPLPLGGLEAHPSEQLAPFAPSPAEVSGDSTNLSLGFVPQWRIDATPAPAVGGVVTPSVSWWNESQPLNLTAAPAAGYAFAGWSGWGPGSYNGTNRSITIVPTGRITEKARFALGDEVVLAETGLPIGANWSVTIRGVTTASTTPFLTVYELPGTYGFTVNPIPGYRSLPTNGAFTVSGPVQVVDVQFILLTPAPPTYPVTFVLSGLPALTVVSVTVRGASQTVQFVSAVVPVAYRLLNGSYAYQVSYVAGYHLAVPEKTFDVAGGPLTVDVPFVASVYSVTWEANGTRPGMAWSVIANGVATAATSAWVSASLPNGSYAYSIAVPANFTATPRFGIFAVGGFDSIIPILVRLVMVPIQFQAVGPPAATGWSVRLGNETLGAAANGSVFFAPNGTFTFDVHAPAGFYAVPSHGTVTVAGPSAPIQIQFFPISNQPSAALVAQLTSGAMSTSFWIGVSILGGFALLRTVRRRGRRAAPRAGPMRPPSRPRPGPP